MIQKRVTTGPSEVSGGEKACFWGLEIKGQLEVGKLTGRGYLFRDGRSEGGVMCRWQ